MLLSKLVGGLDCKIENFRDIQVESIQTDSRLVKKNSIFVAVDGRTNRGIDYVDNAVKNGAVAIVIEEKYNYENSDTVVLKVKHTLGFTVDMLKIFYDNNFPTHLLSITGTKGKTSVVEFVRQAVEHLGHKIASIGTLGINYKNKPPEIKKDFLTTRELIEFYEELHFLKSKKNIDFVIFETTSQGLDTGRVTGLYPEIVGFSNFSQDHLNHHGTMEEYFNCKMKLFREHTTPDTKVVLNADIKEYDIIKDICRESGCDKHIISFGHNGNVKLLFLETTLDSQDVVFEFQNNKYVIKSKLIGEFQAMNLLCAFCYIYNLGIHKNIQDIVDALGTVEPAEGRMNLAGVTKSGANIYVDFAHTASSLECILKTTREHLDRVGDGKVIILFGLGGGKDPSKRPIMGKVAQDLADMVIITNDNFRNEDPAKIRAEIVAGCDRPNDENLYNFTGTREEAIKFAISVLKKNDILILAGKGHEKYSEEYGKTIPFDEFKIVRDNIR
jgi:UDP-N-acetylmuramoyl-L-alanyl-D-glutamate--2,6-diaminopimelate ligase